MRQQASPAQVYEDFAVRYQFRPFAADLVARADPRPGERVLDLACGTGIVARLVASRVAPGGTVTGYDVSPAMLGVARERAAAEGALVGWDQGDAAALPYADGSFDLALCQQGLQYFPDKPAALRELQRVLAPGGRAVVSTWGPRERSPVVTAFLQLAEAHLRLPPDDLATALADADALRGALEGAGFAAVGVTPVEVVLRYASLWAFVRGFVGSLAAILPALAALPPEELEAKARRIAAQLEPEIRPHLDGDGLRCPRETNVAVARR